MAVIPHTFSLPGLIAGAKLPYFGANGALPARLVAESRSLKIEHVSPVTLVHQEICRRPQRGLRIAQGDQHGAAVPDQSPLAMFCQWFWTRKLDAGSRFEGFPATLLDARMVDEWPEVREKSLTGYLCAKPMRTAVSLAIVDNVRLADVWHCRTLGLLLEFDLPAPAAL